MRTFGLRAPRVAALAVAAGLAGCAAGVGIGIPLVPGVSLGVGVGSGGPSIGLGTGLGPLGVGVGVNGSGQVYGGAGVGASTGIGGGARLGAGVGTGTVLYDPNAPRSSAPPPSLSNRGVEQGVVVPSAAYPASPRPQPARPSGGPAQSDSPTDPYGRVLVTTRRMAAPASIESLNAFLESPPKTAGSSHGKAFSHPRR